LLRSTVFVSVAGVVVWGLILALDLVLLNIPSLLEAAAEDEANVVAGTIAVAGGSGGAVVALSVAGGGVAVKSLILVLDLTSLLIASATKEGDNTEDRLFAAAVAAEEVG